jgi:biopolymer transport protein ExbD
MPAVLHRGPRRRTISEINMVPFIDVALVLLIIFMVTAPLITAGVSTCRASAKAPAERAARDRARRRRRRAAAPAPRRQGRAPIALADVAARARCR